MEKGNAKILNTSVLKNKKTLIIGLHFTIGILLLLAGCGKKDIDESNTISTVSEKNVEMLTIEETTIEDVEKNNSWYQNTKLVTEDMELRELTEEELERITKLQQDLFKGLSDEEVMEIKEKLAGVHGGLEGDIVYYDFGTLTDPDSLRWEWFNDTTPDDNVDNGHWGPEVIQDLEEVKAQLSDDRVIKLITEAQDEIQAIMDEHSNGHVMKAHMILHDVDYWLFRYPVAELKIAPADWSGIYIYYGELDGLLRDRKNDLERDMSLGKCNF